MGEPAAVGGQRGACARSGGSGFYMAHVGKLSCNRVPLACLQKRQRAWLVGRLK